ncbi:hypothetical protein ACFOOP_05655 [Marinicaulis aureus]|uniref:Uncharacterized protein n=1 Tax=Hyphococcus aureus TaxID=2666033 RepID=A0ABW1KTY0_9PROT
MQIILGLVVRVGDAPVGEFAGGEDLVEPGQLLIGQQVFDLDKNGGLPRLFCVFVMPR